MVRCLVEKSSQKQYEEKLLRLLRRTLEDISAGRGQTPAQSEGESKMGRSQENKSKTKNSLGKELAAKLTLKKAPTAAEDDADSPESKLTEQQKGELMACFHSFDEDGSGFLCAAFCFFLAFHTLTHTL